MTSVGGMKMLSGMLVVLSLAKTRSLYAKAPPCHRITVSGRTRCSASRHPAHRRESHTQRRRSRARIAAALIRGGAGRVVGGGPGSRYQIPVRLERGTHGAEESEHKGHRRPEWSSAILVVSPRAILFWQTTPPRTLRQPERAAEAEFIVCSGSAQGPGVLFSPRQEVTHACTENHRRPAAAP